MYELHRMFRLPQTVRRLLKAPAFTITAVVILGFGIGANTAIFSLINATLLRPLPYADPERLVMISMPYQNDPQTPLDYADFLDITAQQTCFDKIAISYRDSLDLTGSGKTQRLSVCFVSPSLFALTGRTAILGRTFRTEEDVAHGPLLAVISEQFWRNHFNGDPGVIGKKLILSEQSFEIIGVAPVQVDLWNTHVTDVYLPANTANLFGYSISNRTTHMFLGYGRLKNGFSLAQAQAQLETIQNRLIDQYPDSEKGYGIRLNPLLETVVQGYSGTIWLLGAAVALLLLIAAANVANLLFVRGLERGREMAIRSAIGATRYRLIGHLLLETSALSFLGGILGIALAWGSVAFIKNLSPPDLYRIQQVQVDIPALVFVLGVIVVIAFVSGIVPAFSLSKPKLGSALREEGRGSGTGSPHKYRAQTILVVTQVALACTLLIAAGLMVRSFEAAQEISLGFNPHQLLTAELILTSSIYSDGVKTRAFYDAVLARVHQLPGVTDAAINDAPPLDYDGEYLTQFTIDGRPDPGVGHHPALVGQTISSSYFRTLEIPLLKGREFNNEDKPDSQQAVIIDDALAQHYFAGQNPVGKAISWESPEGLRHCSIVGVVPHVRFMSPGMQENAFQAYFPYSQWDFQRETLVVRCQGDASAHTAAIREAVQSVDPNVPVPNIQTYDDIIAQKLVTRKLASALVSVFSGAALCLSAIGLYGVLAYTVSQRSREIGLRIALGAEPREILHLVARHGFKLLGIGLVAGVVLALIFSRLIGGMLYGVSVVDPISMLVAVLVLSLAGGIACLFPALRAMWTNPATALRQ